jgi:hypothetical protein
MPSFNVTGNQLNNLSLDNGLPAGSHDTINVSGVTEMNAGNGGNANGGYIAAGNGGVGNNSGALNANGGTGGTGLPAGSHDTINVSGATQMNLSMADNDTDTVNLAAHSEWIGGFTASVNDGMNINGTGSFDNLSSNVIGGTVRIGARVIGTGSFSVQTANSKLEFASSVSAHQTVFDNGSQIFGSPGTPGIVQVDDPAAYHATTDLTFGKLILEGITAGSYSLKNDLLTLFYHRQAVDTVSLTGTPAANLAVFQAGSNVVIHTDGHVGGVALPVHF